MRSIEGEHVWQDNRMGLRVGKVVHATEHVTDLVMQPRAGRCEGDRGEIGAVERPLATVYFDLDSSTIRDDARAILAKNADYLKRWTSTRISVEGHCDERGTAEYNLGLGERRATAVREYLVSLGVTGDRIAVIPKGKEAPVCTDRAESCWQQNRRGFFVFTAK